MSKTVLEREWENWHRDEVQEHIASESKRAADALARMEFPEAEEVDLVPVVQAIERLHDATQEGFEAIAAAVASRRVEETAPETDQSDGLSGVLCDRMASLSEAVETLNALVRAPAHHAALEQIAFGWAALGASEHGTARMCARRAVRNEPVSPEALVLLAATLVASAEGGLIWGCADAAQIAPVRDCLRRARAFAARVEWGATPWLLVVRMVEADLLWSEGKKAEARDHLWGDLLDRATLISLLAGADELGDDDLASRPPVLDPILAALGDMVDALLSDFDWWSATQLGRRLIKRFARLGDPETRRAMVRELLLATAAKESWTFADVA